MNIDLNQILARDDYKRLTESLKEKVFEVAKRIRHKILALPLVEQGMAVSLSEKKNMMGLPVEYQDETFVYEIKEFKVK